VLVVEPVGVPFHRFFQHVGVMARVFKFVLPWMETHRVHHDQYEPKHYELDRPYIVAERVERERKERLAARKRLSQAAGSALHQPRPENKSCRRSKFITRAKMYFTSSWYISAYVTLGFFIWLHGVHNIATWSFLAALAVYASFVSKLHDLFHVKNHLWSDHGWFIDLKKKHLIHHISERHNYGIFQFFIDRCMGTYLDPKLCPEFVKEVNITDETILRLADLNNIGDVLLKARPTERAKRILGLESGVRSLRIKSKLKLVLEVVNDRLTVHPQDERARVLKRAAEEVLADPQLASQQA
jgi:hypothetical protein